MNPYAQRHVKVYADSRQGGHAVAAVARDLGVGWATIMRAVSDHGRPLVDDPRRLDGVATLGLDETSFLKATRLARSLGWS